MKNSLKDLESGFDSAVEHNFHEAYSNNCSECFKENSKIQQFRQNELRMSGEQGEGRDIHLENLSALEPRDGSTPWGKNPLE